VHRRANLLRVTRIEHVLHQRIPISLLFQPPRTNQATTADQACFDLSDGDKAGIAQPGSAARRISPLSINLSILPHHSAFHAGSHLGRMASMSRPVHALLFLFVSPVSHPPNLRHVLSLDLILSNTRTCALSLNRGASKAHPSQILRIFPDGFS
jgi:hypothetical protein